MKTKSTIGNLMLERYVPIVIFGIISDPLFRPRKLKSSHMVMVFYSNQEVVVLVEAIFSIPTRTETNKLIEVIEIEMVHSKLIKIIDTQVFALVSLWIKIGTI